MITGQQVKDKFTRLSSGQIEPGFPFAKFPDGIKGAMNGILAKSVGGNANRKLVLKYLAGTTTSTTLTDWQWYALYVLVQPYKDTALGWMSNNPKFRTAIDAVLADMAKMEGQLEMEIEG